MNEKTSPSECGDRTESALAQRPRMLVLQMLVMIVLAAALFLLTINAWLISRWVEKQQAGSREHAFWVLCQHGFPAAERQRAFRELALAGNTEWRSADLQGLDLAGIALPGADLRGAAFRQASLAGADLSQAVFCGGSLELADLSGANLSQADLSETQLRQAILAKANLRRAKLRAASLEQIRGENADLLLADASEANCLMANLSGAKLDGANFSGASLESAVLKDASLLLTRLDDANLKNTDFMNANWWRARGLTTAQTELLKEKFAPLASAPQTLRDDYAKWLANARRD